MRRAVPATALILMLLASSGVWAQHHVDPDPDLASSVAARMIGRWEGSGWSRQGPGEPESFEVVERVRWNLAGTALLVEGLGTATDPETGAVEIGHDAMAVIRIDDTTGTLRFIAGRAAGGFTDHELEIVDSDAGVMRWRPETERGDVRFTITIANDTWTEIGEFSPDGGETWHRFLEMTLERVA